ncbi:hypothetical protein O6H91_12G045600 [Diphasiastrum complanatum]|uniref:Uncharacterized protein n=1 Tax=Diphasiastrum complanatum TaxID=34168 RepID=A0ACC2C162_DIPCM|nr:hypothetical protein O6H91_12G045600 [Diphasiastrum complanatum]
MLEMLCYTFRRKLSSSASLLACAMAEDAVSSASDPPPIIMEGSSDNCSGIPKEANGAICSVSDPPVVVEGSFCKYSGLSAQLVKEATSFKNVSVQAARELLNRGFQYLDVRTPKEYAAGHVEGAVNVPYLYIDETGRLLFFSLPENRYLHVSKRCTHLPFPRLFQSVVRPLRFTLRELHLTLIPLLKGKKFIHV